MRLGKRADEGIQQASDAFVLGPHASTIRQVI
jgi:hypothetical protein